MKRWTLVAATAALTLTVSCSSDVGADRPTASTAGTVLVHGDEMFPFDSPEKMRTFADAWVRVTATAERVGEHEGEVPDEGYRSRYVSLSVDETYWVRDGIEIPAEFETTTGVAVDDGVEVHMVFEGGTDLEVGRSYLAGLAFVDGKLDVVSQRAVRLIADEVVQGGAGEEGSELPEGVDPEVFVATILDAEPLVPDSITDAEARLDAYYDTES